MVFAVAVLLMQIQPVRQVAFVVSPSTPTTSSSPDTKDGKKVTDPITAHPDMDSTVSDKGTATMTDKNASKEPPLSALNNVSLSNTQKQSFSTIRIPEAQPKPIQFASAETFPSRKAWMALSLVQSGAATFDAYTTRQAIRHGAVEKMIRRCGLSRIPPRCTQPFRWALFFWIFWRGTCSAASTMYSATRGGCRNRSRRRGLSLPARTTPALLTAASFPLLYFRGCGVETPPFHRRSDDKGWRPKGTPQRTTTAAAAPVL